MTKSVLCSAQKSIYFLIRFNISKKRKKANRKIPHPMGDMNVYLYTFVYMFIFGSFFHHFNGSSRSFYVQ